MNTEQWTKIKNQGKIRYIVFHWILCAALPAAILLHLLRWALNSWDISSMISLIALRNMLVGFVICSAISVFLGLFTWNRYSKQYKS